MLYKSAYVSATSGLCFTSLPMFEQFCTCQIQVGITDITVVVAPQTSNLFWNLFLYSLLLSCEDNNEQILELVVSTKKGLLSFPFNLNFS